MSETDVQLKHLSGCPREGDRPGEPDTRVERFDRTDADGEPVVVTRCKQCGAQRVDAGEEL